MVPVFQAHRREWLLTAILLLTAVTTMGFAVSGKWLLFVYLVLYGTWVWTPESRRTFPNTLLFTGLAVLGLIGAALSPVERALSAILILPFAGILGGRATASRWAFAAVVMLAGIRVLMSPLTIGNIFAALVSVFGIYWGVYGIHLRREAQALDRQRMSQLESTYRQLQETHQRLIDTTQAVVESRAREARLETLADIHDGVGHRLTSLIIGLESLEMMLPDDPHTARTRVTDLVAIAREALQDVRQAVRARSYDPPDFDRQSFDRLIERVRHNGQMRIDAELPESINHWPDLTRMTLYHILQESLTNVLRHAKADRVRVTLRRQLASVILQVADNGILVQPLIPGFGLVRLRQRCEALGGELQLSVAHPHGLDLQATLPLSQEVNVE